MGGIVFDPGILRGEVGDLIGFKAGLALTESEIEAHLSEDEYFVGAWKANADSPVRLRSEEYEALIVLLLHRVGVLRSPNPTSAFLFLAKKHRKDEHATKILNAALAQFGRFVFGVVGEDDEDGPAHPTAAPRPLDPGPFVEEMRATHGLRGVEIALELLDAVTSDQLKSPVKLVRAHDWADVQELRDLFESERLGGQYGRFLDQRFVDYLANNFDAIDAINWRKFEGLVGEFFHRTGYVVELGPGRNDDGVDARVWSDAEDRAGPPLMLIQCKREKNKISKTVVKALWADVVHAGATSGLIVTTSGLLPGARKTCKVRNYPVEAAERPHLRTWLEQLRTPGTGVFLGA